MGCCSVVVAHALLGRPDFQPKDCKTLLLKVFRVIWSKNLGRPKRRSKDHGYNTPFSALWVKAKNLESILLAEPHVADSFSCRALALSAKECCRSLQIPKPKALNLEKDYLAVLLQKYRARNGRCITILFKSIGVRGRFGSPEWGAKKPNKQKTHKHFSRRPLRGNRPGTNPHPSQGQTGQNGDFTVELNRKRLVSGTGPSLSRGGVPFVPRDGSCLSRPPSRPKCLCLLVFFLSDWNLGHPKRRSNDHGSNTPFP